MLPVLAMTTKEMKNRSSFAVRRENKDTHKKIYGKCTLS